MHWRLAPHHLTSVKAVVLDTPLEPRNPKGTQIKSATRSALSRRIFRTKTHRHIHTLFLHRPTGEGGLCGAKELGEMGKNFK